jgi:hypothetical protein
MVILIMSLMRVSGLKQINLLGMVTQDFGLGYGLEDNVFEGNNICKCPLNLSGGR